MSIDADRQVRLHLQGALAVHAAAVQLARDGWDLIRIDQREQTAGVYTLTLRLVTQGRRRASAVGR